MDALYRYLLLSVRWRKNDFVNFIIQATAVVLHLCPGPFLRTYYRLDIERTRAQVHSGLSGFKLRTLGFWGHCSDHFAITTDQHDKILDPGIGPTSNPASHPPEIFGRKNLEHRDRVGGDESVGGRGRDFVADAVGVDNDAADVAGAIVVQQGRSAAGGTASAS